MRMRMYAVRLLPEGGIVLPILYPYYYSHSMGNENGELEKNKYVCASESHSVSE